MRIKELINRKNLNISSFERSIGVGNNTIGTILNRNSNVSGEILSKILNHFTDVSADWLITGKGEMYREIENRVKEETEKYGLIGIDENSKNILNSISEKIDFFYKDVSEKIDFIYKFAEEEVVRKEFKSLEQTIKDKKDQKNGKGK